MKFHEMELGNTKAYLALEKSKCFTLRSSL